MIKYIGKYGSIAPGGAESEGVFTPRERYYLIDSLRGAALLLMLFYHALWDIVNLFGVDAEWFTPSFDYLLQRFICITFILLSGFCSQLGRHPYRRGIILIGASAVIFAVTALAMPSSVIIFGVLTLIGVCTIIIVPLKRALDKVSTYLGFCLSIILYLCTEWLSAGFLGMPGFGFFLPEALYANYFTAFLGFPHENFRSADYFPLLPWIFIFIAGYFLFRIFSENGLLRTLKAPRIQPLEWIGRRTLIIYMLHQPVIYGALYVIFKMI